MKYRNSFLPVLFVAVTMLCFPGRAAALVVEFSGVTLEEAGFVDIPLGSPYYGTITMPDVLGLPLASTGQIWPFSAELYLNFGFADYTDPVQGVPGPRPEGLGVVTDEPISGISIIFSSPTTGSPFSPSVYHPGIPGYPVTSQLFISQMDFDAQLVGDGVSEDSYFLLSNLSFDNILFTQLGLTFSTVLDTETIVGTIENITYSEGTVPVAATPLPPALPLFAAGLGLLILIGRRRKALATP